MAHSMDTGQVLPAASAAATPTALPEPIEGGLVNSAGSAAAVAVPAPQ